MRARIPLLSPDDCARAWADVEAVESFWTPRHSYLPSFTLGAAAYLDVPRHGVAAYVVRAVRNNKRLRRDFGWLLERISEGLADHLEAPVQITQRFAVPGFHVFRHHDQMHELKPSVHFDLQQYRLDFPMEDVAHPERCFSFTIPIVMPSAGAGLYIWDQPLHETPDRSETALRQLGEDLEPEYHGYALGELYLHDGLHLHAIAGDRAAKPGESRVTMQGHGLFTGGAWQIYW